MSKKNEMKQIVIAAGECWHKYGALSLTNEHGLMCEHCSVITGVNPSPHDLNELVRLTDQLKYNLRIESVFVDYGVLEYQIHLRKHGRNVWGMYAGESTPDEALRNALVKVVK